MSEFTTASCIQRAYERGLAIPAFNVPYLPMIKPVIEATAACDAFSLVSTARLEWVKFEAKGPREVAEEYFRWEQPKYVRLHLDHLPVIDEDNLRVNYETELKMAVDAGCHSVMVDASRLPLEENIACTQKAVAIAHTADIPCEAELGAVMGHEAGPMPPYDELFESGRGFTQVEEAVRFVKESGCDWLSVAVGTVHGPISAALKDKKKVTARINLDHLEKLRDATGIPLVLHGGTGVAREYVLESFKRGIAKLNIAMEIRQAYEGALRDTGDVEKARAATYDRVRWILEEQLGFAGQRAAITGE